MSDTIVTSVTDTVRAYIRIEQELADHDEARKRLATDLRHAEELAIEAFVDAGVSDMSVDGRRWKPEFKTIVSPASGKVDDLVSYIVEHGGSDLVQPSMHHSRRDAWLREHCINDDGEVNIPVDMAGLVQTFEKVSLSKRKV